MNPSVNVLGKELQECSKDPLTGWYRDGCCNTDSNDRGLHVVCCIVTEGFLNFAKSKGNDLITPAPHFNFPGLKPGDRWCKRTRLRWKRRHSHSQHSDPRQSADRTGLGGRAQSPCEPRLRRYLFRPVHLC